MTLDRAEWEQGLGQLDTVPEIGSMDARRKAHSYPLVPDAQRLTQNTYGGMFEVVAHPIAEQERCRIHG